MVWAVQRYIYVALVLTIALATLIFLQPHASPVREVHTKIPHKLSNPRKSTLRRSVESLFRPIRLSPTQPGYHDEKGTYFAGANPHDVTWTKPMKKRLLIVDIDTRVPKGDNQILNPDKKIDWDALELSGAGFVSHAISNHYLYAMIHGYDYKYYQARDLPDHFATWIRPHVFKELLPDYDFVVSMDADAIISHLEVPFEWLFNRWGITKQTSMALPYDTQEYVDGKPHSVDSFGVPVLNGGFVITQHNDLTFAMLSAWGNCTTETRYPGCAQWKNKWSHEQRAFSEYVRWDPEFNQTENFVVGIPCDDAMGWKGFKDLAESRGNKGIDDCKGNFVRHYTIGKEFVKEGGNQVLTQAMVEVMQKNLLRYQDTLVEVEKGPNPKSIWSFLGLGADDKTVEQDTRMDDEDSDDEDES